jgi:hypothetical protein
MLKMYQYALVACAAIASFVGGAHVVKVYADTQLTSAVKAILAADAASKPANAVEPPLEVEVAK